MLQTFILCILAAGTVISGISYTLYWRSALRDPHHSHGTAFSSGSGLFFCVLRAFMGSVFSQFFIYASYPLGFLKPRRGPKFRPDCEKPTVVLVHGLYHNASAWYVYSWMLRRQGYANIVCWSYNTVKYDFWELAEQLRGVVARASETSGGQVALMGHSLGGLLARAAVADPDCASRVLALVALGSPHGGSTLAGLALGRLGRSLAHGGELVRRLAALPCPRAVPKLNIYSPLDNMVLPTGSLEIGQPGWVQAETAPISHVSMLYHPPTLRLALDFMEEATGCAACRGEEALAGA
ncbi:esterase/lipase family protein [Fundidesulfovibrio agrisoli]|uniref:esterase/lipase family protein n=1 Tax=Fundidesulfovibrio agrisoli TaxID=2922717 RepID=UPI001FAE57CD|nr:alpha/beta fold hydrolase [Fundidesulfovibrio agrisoli]